MPTGKARSRSAWVVPATTDGVEPPALDLAVPSMARLYNLALGGKDNLPVDRAAFDDVLRVFPACRATSRANRRFRDRAVRHMAQQGIGQFLDLGSGLPFRPHLHHYAGQVRPGVRVVYVDNDAMAVAHSRALVATRPGLDVELLDITEVEDVLRSPAVSATLDLTAPVGLVCTAVLHFMPAAQARAVVARYRDALAPGSMVALSVLTHDPEGGESLDVAALDEVTDRWDIKLAASRLYLHPQTAAEVHSLFDGFTIEAPGVVGFDEWPERAGGAGLPGLAGLGRLER